MSDLSVIILTFNEEIHIRRCIENVRPVAKDVFVVDSFSTDKTAEIAASLGAKVFKNKWENNHARQFNWGLGNLPIQTKWVLRLDADEYLMPELIEELGAKLDTLAPEITGVILKRRHIFLGRWVKNGIYPIKLLRIFQTGHAICEERWMDENIQLLDGFAIEFSHDFVDHNLNNLSWWTAKHVGYAVREAADLLDMELHLTGGGENSISGQAGRKRKMKSVYLRLPLFLRAFLYFHYRYFLRLGFWEGKEGFLWNFLQGFWYRVLVDAKIFEIKRACGDNPAEIRVHLWREYHLAVDSRATESQKTGDA
ncbi:MAG: glycosyltransferase family 2 protein [Desulfobulbaceae bacterium]|nr:glycosyltransferase family 2 protein [Desulfobulbaceae bacterium]